MSAMSLRREQIESYIRGPEAPSAVEAEKALLGIVLADPGALDLIEGLNAPHFHSPLLGRIYAAMLARHQAGGFVEPELLDSQFLTDEPYLEAGGMAWLLDLRDTASSPSRAQAYADEIRETAQRRDLLKLAGQIADDVREGEASTADLIGKTEASLLAMQVSSRRLEPITAGAAAGRVLDALDAPAETVFGLSTGLKRLDEELGPLIAGNVVALAARTSMGKSAGMEVIGFNIAEAGAGFLQISTEMSVEEMAQRHLADICQRRFGNRGPEYRDIRRRKVTADQREMLRWAKSVLDRVPLVMIKRAGVKLSMVRSIARRQAAIWARSGIALGGLAIDHMGHVRLDRPSRDRYADQTEISQATKEMADELECVVFPLLQLNREPEKRDDPRPRISDLRDSGAWEQDADIIIGWFREAYYAQRQPEPKEGGPGSAQANVWAEWDRARRSPVIEAILLKGRMGPPATVKLWSDIGRNAIRDTAPEGDLI